jgi:hypothetical protein
VYIRHYEQQVVTERSTGHVNSKPVISGLLLQIFLWMVQACLPFASNRAISISGSINLPYLLLLIDKYLFFKQEEYLWK